MVVHLRFSHGGLIYSYMMYEVFLRRRFPLKETSPPLKKIAACFGLLLEKANKINYIRVVFFAYIV